MNLNIHRYIKTAFDYADRNNEGSLTKHQYKIAMTALFGYCPNKLEINYVFRSSSHKKISFKEFEYWAFKKYPINQLTISLETIFGLIDSDNKGYLTMIDLWKTSEIIDMRISPLVWYKTFKELDQFQKGYIDLY
ncbi:EF-hand calcium-binding domain-containing protein 11-like [Polistes fuscatus]|uniref:EF-hand calcium-binding domain-containing protein 11-like n=1 Tax=Polistes fuscatus TaxID=30207 RepID=UPI001CA99FD9|nr:EF-hand calcium-binding domain-containing protein 11-like [Polistes fuscatus]